DPRRPGRPGRGRPPAVRHVPRPGLADRPARRHLPGQGADRADAARASRRGQQHVPDPRGRARRHGPVRPGAGAPAAAGRPRADRPGVDQVRARRGRPRRRGARRPRRAQHDARAARHVGGRRRPHVRADRRRPRLARGLERPGASAMSRSRRAGFTLLEIIVAMGVLAIGATAAFALLVAAASAGRRAEHQVNAALLADTVIDDLKADLTFDLDLTDLPLAAEVIAQRQARGDLPADAPTAPNPETRYVDVDAVRPDYPDYKYDLAITPIEGPVPDQPWEFLVEVDVRWSDQGQRRNALFSA